MSNPNPNPNLIPARVAGGKTAREALELLRDALAGEFTNPSTPEAFAAAESAAVAVQEWLDRWRKQFGITEPPAKQSDTQPMTNREAREFEQEVMPFGLHRGKPMGDVPLDYLDWLLGKREQDTKRLTAYLLARRSEPQETE